MRKFYLTAARKMSVNNKNSVKKRIHFLLIHLMFFVAIVFTTKLNAQTAAQYSFSATSGAYTEISGDPILLDAGNSDDGYANGFPIGFDFEFGGVIYNEFNVSTNGWITLANSGNNNITNSGLGNNFATIPKSPILAALWDDNEVTDIDRDLSYKTSNGVLTIQFSNIKWNYQSAAAAISFQIKLYEATGAVEFVYDQIDGGVLNNPTASIGIATASGVYLSVNGTGTAPTASSTTSTNNLSTLPARGQTYTFLPPPACSGAPTPGRTFASVNSVCASSGATVNLSFETFALATTFLWQQSTDGGITWPTVSGTATNSTYVATPTATTQYRCRVTCTNGGASNFSLPTTVTYDNSCIVMPVNEEVSICSATFYDAGGPTATYGVNEVRQLTINPSTTGAKVKVVFNSFDTESRYDGLMIYNGRTVDPANLISSGLPVGINPTTAPAGSFHGTTSPGTVTSTDADGALTFVFRSDNIIQNAGWNATISCNLPCNATPVPGATLATSTFVCNGFTTTLSIANNNIAGATYQWQSSVDNATWSDITGAISTTFTASPTSNVYFRCKVICTAAPAVPAFSTSIQIETSACDEILMPSDGSVLTPSPNTCSALFTDGGGARSNYVDNSNGTVTFFPSTPGRKIRATFTSFSTENRYDGLMIYNGRDITQPLISSGLPVGLNATTAPAGSFYGTTSPGVVSSTASDGSLTFVFKSDGSQVSSGWVATISCYVDNSCTGTPNPGATVATPSTVCYGGTTTLSTSNTINANNILYQWQSLSGSTWSDITGATSTTYVVSSLTASTFFRATVRCTSVGGGVQTSTQLKVVVDSTCINMPTSATLATCTANFFDNGGASANYTENQNRTFTVTPTTAGSVNGPFSRVIFSNFTLDPSDTLKVYDGNNTSAPLIGAYTTNPGTITSSNTTNGGLTFVFKSNATLNDAGWAGAISCYTPILCSGAPPSGNVLASIDTVCASGSTNLSLSNAASLPGGLTYQWQSSPNGISGWTNVGTSLPTFSPTNITTTTWYQCIVSCSGVPTTFNNVKVLVTPRPVITVSSATNICGSGAVVLSASSSVAGATIRWYSNAAGTLLVGTGATYTTPTISTNTTYYVEAIYGDCESGLSPIVAIVNPFPSNLVINPQADTICVSPNIDSLRTTGGLFADGSQAPITWSPIANLYTDADATIPYTGTSATKVYIKSTEANNTVINYIATAGTGCNKKDTSVITFRDFTPSVTIAIERPLGAICPSDTIKFRATPVNGGNVGQPASFKFFVNDSAITANFSTTDTIRFPGALTSYRLNNGDIVKCVMLVNPFYTNCSNSNQFVSNSVTMTINTVKRDSVLLSASATSICTGTSVTFTATPQAFPGTAPEYEFLVNGSIVRARSAVTTYATSTLTNGQVVTVRMYSNEPCVTPTPAVSLPITMTVTPFTAISVALNSSVGSTACPNTNVVFSAVPSVSTPTSTYQFFKNNISVQGPTTSSTYTYQPVNGDQIKVVYNSNFSACLTGNPDTSNIITMTVSSSNVATVALNPTTAICEGVAKIFTATNTGGGPAPLYEFFVNSSSVQGPSTTATFSRSATANYNIEVRMTPDGCGLPNPATASFTQVVNPTPQGSLSGNTICTGGTGQLTFTASSGTGPFSLVINGVTYNSITSGTPFNASVNPTTTTGYTLTSVTDANGCNRLTSFTGASATITVNTSPSVSITNNSSGATVLTCTTTQINLTATPNGAGFSVLWSNGIANSTLLIIAPGTYNATVTQTSTGCSTTSSNIVITQNANEPTGAGLSGTYFIPSGGASCRNFASIRNAVDTLNKYGVLGNVIINVAGGYTETLTRRLDLGSAILSANTALGRTITFIKTGAGANPKITAHTGVYTNPGSTTIDGMWSLSGVDNVTIDGIDLLDANTASPATMMEYGYGLFKGYGSKSATSNNTIINVTDTVGLRVGSTVWVISGTGSFTVGTTIASIPNATSFTVSAAPAAFGANTIIGYSVPNDGAQNNTIKNCVITLNKANNALGVIPVLIGSVGIASYNSTSAVAITALIPTAKEGGNSRNKFYTNTISNCSIGIGLSGYTGTNAGRDTLNDIGGASLATGNTITNFGGAGFTNEVNGIRLRGQFDVNASYNTINNNIGATANPSGGAIRGIYGESGANADTTIITYNNISINNGSAQQSFGIDNTIGNGILNGNGVNISYNTVTGTNNSQTLGNLYAINNTAAVANLNISNNKIQDFSMNGAGEWRGIYNGGACTNVTMNFDTIQNNNLNNIGNTITTQFIYSAALTVTSLNATFNNNQILNNTKGCGIAGGSLVYGINFQGASLCSAIINNNTISNNTLNNTGTGTIDYSGFNLGGASRYTLDNNTVSNFGINVNAATSAILKVNGIRSEASSILDSFVNNTLTQLYIKGSSTSTGLNEIRGIGTNSGAGSRYYFNNNINNLYSKADYSTVITGIRNQAGLTVNILKNKIYGLYPGQSATVGSTAKGINIVSLSGSSTANIYNNFISIDLSTGAPVGSSGTALNNLDGIRGIELASTIINASNIFVHNNSIRLAGTGTTNFGSSGIYQANNATSTIGLLNLKGNIISNECTKQGTGLIAAFRRNSLALNNYSTASNYNSFYAGTDTTVGKLFLVDATSNFNGNIAGLRTRLGAESGSISALPTFVAPATGDLHITPCAGSNSSFENAVIGTALFTTDYDGDTRLDPSDIGADEISSGSGKVNSDASVCSGSNGATLTLTNAPSVTSITRWEQSVDGGTNWTTIANTTTTYTYSNLTTTTLFRAIVNTASCSNVSSGAATITVNSAPSITAQPSTVAQNTCLNIAFATPTVSITTSAASPTYQWFSNTTNSNIGGTPVGTNSPSYTLPFNVAGATYYYCTVTSGVCPSTSNVSAAMTVNALPTITLTDNVADSVCFSNSTQNSVLEFTGTTNGANQYNITWNVTPSNSFLAVTNGTLATSPITIVVPASATANSTYTGNLSVRNSTTGCVSATPATAFTIKVKSLVNVSNPNTTPQTTCLNSSFTTPTISVSSTSSSPTYQWFSNTTNTNVSGTNLGAANGAQTTTYSPQSNVVSTLYYYAVITSNGCSATTNPSGLWSVTTGPTSGALSGTYFIPTTSLTDCKVFGSIAAAVTYLNANGISQSVVFKVAAGYTETLTSSLAMGSATLNSTSAIKTIRFEKNGPGANPLITAYTGGSGTSATNPDGIWSLRGVDYVTIDGIDIRENSSNTTAASQMEYGYGLFKLGVADGAQNDTIKNCTITLNKNNTTTSTNFFNGATGIAMTNATADAANTLLTPNNVSGANSNNTFISNTISNVNVGIGLIGFVANDQASFADVNNLVGDTITSSKGNTITNLGGGTTANNAEVSTGVLLKNQLNALVGYNTITGAGHNEDQYGVKSDNTQGAGSIVIKQNNISITGAADKKYAGIENNTGGGASFIINITNNTLNVKIQNSFTTTVAASVTGIKNGSTLTPGTINISNNSFTNSTIAGAGKWTGIYNTSNATALTGVINMNNNTISGNTILATGGPFNGLQSDANTYGTQSINTNTITNNSKTISGVTELSWLSQKPSSITNCGTLNIQNNIIENNEALVAIGNASNVNVYGVYSGGIKNGAILSFSGNTIRKLSLKDVNSTFTGKLWGLFTNSNFGANTTETVADNKISNLFISAAAGSSATHTISGLQLGGTLSTVTVRNVFQNRIDSFYVRNNNDTTAYNSTVTGIYIPVGTGTHSIYTNKIAHLIPFGSAGIARGFWLGTTSASNTPVSIYNNMIELDMTQAFDGASATSLNNADAIRGIDLAGGAAGTPYNLTFNTIRIGGTGGSSFGTSVVDMNSNNPTYTFKNNVFVNKATPGASGNVAVLRAVASQLSGPNRYSTSSSNNAYYAGVASSSNYLFTDGTNNFQTLASLQASSRELNSVENADPIFVRSSDNQDSLHMNTSSNCAFNGTGVAGTGYTTDIDGDNRLSPPDMGADEFNTTGGGVGEWAGINTNWNDGVNWCGAVPTVNTDVTIPNGRSNYPIINSSNPAANTKNLTIGNTASVEISSGGKLNIYGTISSPGTGRLNATLGTVEMAGSAAQTIPANLFANNNLRNLVINNTSVTLGGQLNLLNKLSFTGSSRTFATGSFLTLKSTDTLTASVADITNNLLNTGNTITGNVSVERFISNIKNGTRSLKAWRLLSMPTTHNSQTIKQAWQENGNPSGVFNPNPGFGAQIISRFGVDNAGAQALGFDSYNANGGTLKTFNIATQAWDEVPNTISNFDAQKPYIVFVRGSRAKTLFTDIPDTTVLRERGALNLGDFTVSNVPQTANKFASIVNPYASAIRLPVTRSGFNDFYYLYDPRIGASGGWVTISGNGLTASNTAGSYNNGNYNIQSGQGFFMQTNAAVATMTIKETDKVDGSASVQRENRNQQKFYTRLYKVQNGTADLYDGVLNRFDESYSNDVDDEDASKFTNTTENFAIIKNGQLISIESRKALTENDTIFYKMNQMRVANYRFEFIPENIETFNLQAYLEDKYNNTLTPVSMSEKTTFDFAVSTNVGAYASDRFRIIFKQLRPLPVTFVDVKANKQKEQINVTWKVENEINIREYAVEKSANGVNFVKVGTEIALGLNEYAHVDESPFAGNNFYRIRSAGITGEISYSKIVKVSYEAEPMISIYPNPIKSDRKATISFKNVIAGNYTLRLTNNLGQVLMRKSIQHDGVRTQYDFTLSKSILNGSYTLEIIGQDNKKTSLKILF